MKTFYITTPIYYTSGLPHLGHVYSTLVADVFARWHRLIGHKVYFQTGTDEHGQKIAQIAHEQGKDPMEYVNEVVKPFLTLGQQFSLDWDYFIRTTNPQHEAFVQDMFQRSFDAGDIYKGNYEGLYCVDCERFYAPEDLINGIECSLHKKPCQTICEESYFFRLSAYRDRLLTLYNNHPEFIQPESKRNEIIQRLSELRDLSISRKNVTWGIPLPFDKEHTAYVWFDALFNYASGPHINKNAMWPADVHIIGKDISWFHCVYWPAFLMSVGLALPTTVFVHGFIVDKDGHKMSKSLGNVVDPFKLKEKYGIDETRYGLLSLGTFGEDIRFDEAIFVERINNDLNNDYGNLVSRVHTLVQKSCQGIVPKRYTLEKHDEELLFTLERLYKRVDEHLRDFEISKALDEIWTVIRKVNSYINECAPWSIKDEQRLHTVLNITVTATCVLSGYASIILPEKSQQAVKQFGASLSIKSINPSNKKLQDKVLLFKKYEINVVKSVAFRLRVAKIKDVQVHPDASKLYVLQLDVGMCTKQIVSGLCQHYSPQELLDKHIVLVDNLKPAVIRGVESQGMLLAGEDENKVRILQADQSQPGTIVTVDGYEEGVQEISIDTFLKVKLRVKDNNVYLDGHVLKTPQQHITVDLQKGLVH